jgi:hypothetical protein
MTKAPNMRITAHSIEKVEIVKTHQNETFWVEVQVDGYTILTVFSAKGITTHPKVEIVDDKESVLQSV